MTDDNMWQKQDIENQWKSNNFLQSWDWGEFQEALGRKVLRFSWDNKIFAQAVKMNLPFGFAYWYIARGPYVLPDTNGVDVQSAMRELSEELGKHGALFLRVDPLIQIDLDCKRVASTQPECTRIIDLAQDEDAILSAMHQKTRYNIRLAQRKGVKIRKGSIDEFLRLNRETKKRDKFLSHPNEHYEKMINTLPSNFIKIFKAEINSDVLASAVILYSGNTATYAHGASSNENKELMAPHLLHWKIIQDARNRGYKYYDLFGVNPDDKNHKAYKKSWKGISRFKAGFGRACL